MCRALKGLKLLNKHKLAHLTSRAKAGLSVLKSQLDHSTRSLADRRVKCGSSSSRFVLFIRLKPKTKAKNIAPSSNIAPLYPIIWSLPDRTLGFPKRETQKRQSRLHRNLILFAVICLASLLLVIITLKSNGRSLLTGGAAFGQTGTRPNVTTELPAQLHLSPL